MTPKITHIDPEETIRKLKAKVVRLEKANQTMLEALTWIADQTYDPWTNGYEAQRVAAAAIDKATVE